jgi:hypothetical protein
MQVGMPSSKKPLASNSKRVTESVSVVLRRQVPPRSKAPRSWLGGLPMLPEHVEWPRSESEEYPEKGERPLHFVAQIACADLPPQLWGGLGPRHGWLLLFIDPNLFQPDGPDALRVMHIEALGPERAAPDDLGPVADGKHGSSDDYAYYGSLADIPSTWRRWPVDLVVVPKGMHEDADPTRHTPSKLEKLLYKRQTIAHGAPSNPEPFTWRGALYVLNVLERPLAEPLFALKLDRRFVSRLRRPGYADSVLREFDEKHAEFFDTNRAFLEGPDPTNSNARKRRDKLLAVARNINAERASLATFLERHATPDAMVDQLHEAHRRYLAWRISACERIAKERAAVLAHDLDAPMPVAAWRALKNRLRRDTFRFFTTDQVRRDNAWHDVLKEREVAVYTDRPGATFELVADYYADAHLRKLIPASVLSAFEPYYRCLINDHPHRMGGFQGGIQSAPPSGPTEYLLLFQIACDGAMNWWWADVGAYYVFIDVKSLRKGDLSQAWLTLESH